MDALVIKREHTAIKQQTTVEQYFRLLYGDYMQEVPLKRHKKNQEQATTTYDRNRPWVFMMSDNKQMTYRAATFSTLFSLLWDEDKDTTYYTPNSFYRGDQRSQDHARWIHAIAIDIDTKTEEMEGTTLVDVMDLIKNAGLPLPTIIVKTPSAGFHVTWVINQEMPVRATPKTIRLFEAIQRHISDDLNGDRYAVGVERYFRTPTESNICYFNPVKIDFQTFIDWRNINHPYEPSNTTTRAIVTQHNIMGHPAIQRLYNQDAKIGERDRTCFTLTLAMKFSGYSLDRAESEIRKWWHECCEQGKGKKGVFSLKDALRKVRLTFSRRSAKSPSPEHVRQLTGMDFDIRDLKARYISIAKPRERRQRVHNHEWLEDILAVLKSEKGILQGSLADIAKRVGCAVSTLQEVLKKGVDDGVFQVESTRGRNGRTTITAIPGVSNDESNEFNEPIAPNPRMGQIKDHFIKQDIQFGNSFFEILSPFWFDPG